MRSQYFGLFSAIAFLAVSLLGHGVTEAKVSHADVFTRADPDSGELIPEADREIVGSARLKRTAQGIRVTVRTSQLAPGGTYTNWWIIFNNPEACTDGCGADDLPNPDVEASVVYATGRVADADGNTTFRAFLPVGFNLLNRTAEGRERQRLGPSLQNPWTAEIHYLIRWHGPASADAAELLEQISTFGGLCTTVPNDVGDCVDVQAIVFPLPHGQRNGNH